MTKQTSLGIIAEIYLNLYCSTHSLKRPLTPEQVKDAGLSFLDDVAAAEIKLMLDHEREDDAPHEREPEEPEFNFCHLKTLVDQFVEGYFANFEWSLDDMTEWDADECVAYFHDLLFEAYRPEPDQDPNR